MSDASNPKSQVSWTPEQRAAIEARGGNVAVSASAGTGKTAVLTERVLQLISESTAGGVPRVGIEHLLVITFTDKAARQMRERIERRIREALDFDRNGPNSAALRHAIDALPAAWIMTIDAFCLRVVKENFHVARVSPDVRIPDAPEAAEMQSQAIQNLLERWAAQAARREPLQELLRGTPGGAAAVGEQVARLLGFLDSLDQPAAWLAERRATFASTLAARTFLELPEARAAHAGFKRATGELAATLRTLIAAAVPRGADPAPLAQWRAIADELARRAASNGPFDPDSWRAWAAEALDEPLGKIMNKGQCGAALYQDKDFIASVLKPFAGHYARHWREFWLSQSGAALFAGAQLAARQCGWLLDLAEEARADLAAAQARRGLMTFSDVAQCALRVLSDPGGADLPSEVARAYRQRFAHVLVDEYQDTSPLQDALIRRVARGGDPAPGEAGNLFIVGDVKQSIYRFRHAEPLLFLEKLGMANASAAPHGHALTPAAFAPLRLATNFRSRHAILDFVNACFERLMDEAVGEMEYDAGARLLPSPACADASGAAPEAIEIHWMDRDARAAASPDSSELTNRADSDQAKAEPDGESGNAEPPEGIEAEAQWVARRIRALTDPTIGLMIHDDEKPGALRRTRPGDCAILLRGLRSELETWRKALEAEGLSVRTPGLSPLFSAPELIDLLGALRIADQPLQDIPLAALLRSPLVGLTDDELLEIRAAHREGPFYEAVFHAAGRTSQSSQGEATEAPSPITVPKPLAAKLAAFASRVDSWRALARRGAASAVLERILADTSYGAWLLGRPDGRERLDRVDYLHALLERLAPSRDGANPLAGFLELVERLQRTEGELGELPEPAGDACAAVNLLTIHKSKGLEFPIVFLPRLERAFHASRVGDTIVTLREGMARMGIDAEGRRRFATLAHRRLADAQRRRERAEEIRLLYVAMTRARERLVLVAQLRGLEGREARWRAVAREAAGRNGTLDRLHARSPADLLGPVVAWLEANPPRGAAPWLQVTRDEGSHAPEREAAPAGEIPAEDLALVERALRYDGAAPESDWLAAQAMLAARARNEDPFFDSATPRPIRLLPPIDPAAGLTRLPGKATVTQLRRGRGQLTEALLDGDARELDLFMEDEMRRPYFTRGGSLAQRRPIWREAAAGADSSGALRKGAAPPGSTIAATAAERGTWLHQFMAGVTLHRAPDPEALREEGLRLAREGILGAGLDDRERVVESLDWPAIEWFFATAPGRRLIAEPARVSRELPFTVRKFLADFDPATAAAYPTESILVQGVIDVVIDDGDAVTILDYKTDRLRGEGELAARADEYDLQIEQYARALESIWQPRRVYAALVFMDARRIVWREGAAPDWAREDLAHK